MSLLIGLGNTQNDPCAIAGILMESLGQGDAYMPQWIGSSWFSTKPLPKTMMISQLDIQDKILAFEEKYNNFLSMKYFWKLQWRFHHFVQASNS